MTISTLKQHFALAVTSAAVAASLFAPIGAQAQSASDFFKSVGLGLGAGGNCNTAQTDGTGWIKNKDGAITKPAEIHIGATDCTDSLKVIKHLGDGALQNERQMIQSANTVGMINSIGSIAVPLLGGLFNASRNQPQQAEPASDNRRYMEVIERQAQQIEELKAMYLSQRRGGEQEPERRSYDRQAVYGASLQDSGNGGVRSAGLF